MDKTLRDYNVCLKCKLSEPLIVMPLKNGLPRGICRDCYNLQERDRRNKAAVSKTFYNHRQSLTAFNGRALGTLKAPSVYPLTYLNSGRVVGWIMLKYESYLTEIWHAKNRYRIDIASMALFLSNQGLAIGADAITLQAKGGATLDPAVYGDELELEAVVDRLLMFDLKLQDYAVRKVKAELGLLKDKAAEIAKRAPVVRMGSKARLVERKPDGRSKRGRGRPAKEE